MTQRAPRSIRLTEDEEKKSDRLAKREGLKWHSWAVKTLREAIAGGEKPKKIKRLASDHSEQERCT